MIRSFQALRGARPGSNPVSVIPGWCASTRPQMCNCTSGNLEIPGSMLSHRPGMTAPPSPHPEARLAEQRFLRRGLRAPVLRWRLDLAAEFGGGVPAPARIVKHGARQRDHVGLAGGEDGLGLFR